MSEDAAALRALASAVLGQAVRELLNGAEPRTVAERQDREDLAAFLLDPADPRLATWCTPLGLDPDAVRDGLRRRLADAPWPIPAA